MLRIRSGRQVAVLWVLATIIFVVSARVSIALSPSEPVTSPPASYYAGLVGLLAIGAALALTWGWARRGGPGSSWARGLVQALVVIGAVLWLLAMVFPFL